jgi:hypothetical protein
MQKEREYISLCAHDREHWFELMQENAKALWLQCVNCGLRMTESKQLAPGDVLAARGLRPSANKT